MTALARMLAAPPEARRLALALLDEVSAPLTPRQLEHALAASGMPRTQRRALIKAIKHIPIVSVGAVPITASV